MPSEPAEAPTPEVTLVIPTYNRAHLVSNAIDSALGQDYPNLTVIVVDDGSTDDTRRVLRAYESNDKVTVVVRESNGGVMAAKNTGLDAVPPTTKYLGILDSDDTLVPDAVSTLVAGFESSTTALSQVFGWCVDAETLERTGTMTKPAGLISYEDALCGRFDGEFWQLISRESLGSLRFDNRAGGNEAMVWWPMMKNEAALLVDAVVRHYDRSGEDRVNRPAFTQRGAERKMWGYASLLERVGDDMKRVCPQRFSFMSLEHAKWAALAGRWTTLVGALYRAWQAHPSGRVAKVGLLALAPATVLRYFYAHIYRSSR